MDGYDLGVRTQFVHPFDTVCRIDRKSIARSIPVKSPSALSAIVRLGRATKSGPSRTTSLGKVIVMNLLSLAKPTVAGICVSILSVLMSHCSDSASPGADASHVDLTRAEGDPNKARPVQPQTDSKPKSGLSDEELRSIAGTTQNSSGDSACRDVLMSGVYNHHREELTDKAVAAMRRDHCVENENEFAEKVRKYYGQKHSSSNASASSMNVGLEYMGELGLDFGTANSGSHADSSELTDEQARSVVSNWKSKFCSAESKYTNNEFVHLVLSDKIAPEVIDAWRACVTKVHNGLFCGVSNVGDLVSVEVKWEPNELQRRMLPTLNLKWDTVTNLEIVSTELPNKIGTGTGKSAGFRRNDYYEAGLIQLTGQDEAGLVNFKCSLPVPAGITREKKADASCGVENFNLKADPACGIAAFNERAAAPCPVSDYRSARSASCGVERYREGTGGACGTHDSRDEWQEAARLPRFETECDSLSAATNDRCRDIEIRSQAKAEEETRTAEAAGELNRKCQETVAPNAFSAGWSLEMDHKFWVRKAHCKVTNSNTCRHESFGVELYKECRHPDHGVETFQSCQNSAFGVAAYNQCRKSEFGVESFKTCLVETRLW